MKGLMTIGLLVGFGVALFALGGESDDVPDEGIAVVELYTDLKCGRCNLISKIEAAAALDGTLVFTLAFVSTLKSPQGHARHKAYCDAFDTSCEFGQVVINGDTLLDPERSAVALRSAVTEALEPPREVKFEVSHRTARTGGLFVTYALEPPLEGLEVHAVLLEDMLKVSHWPDGRPFAQKPLNRVVRAFATGTEPEGELRLDADEAVYEHNASILVFAQDPETLSIVGAVEIIRL